MVLGQLPVPGRPTVWITVGQGSTGGVVWTFYLHLSFLSSFSLSLIDLNTVSKGSETQNN